MRVLYCALPKTFENRSILKDNKNKMVAVLRANFYSASYILYYNIICSLVPTVVCISCTKMINSYSMTGENKMKTETYHFQCY